MSAVVATWAIGIATVAAMLIRPRGIAEAVWAVVGAALIVLFGLLSIAQTGAAIARGLEVYLFLLGMMVFAETLRIYGTFAWLSTYVLRAARGSQTRLFGLTFALGVAVTALLSNDATVVGLTPAVVAIVRRARVRPLPYLYACAFVANAASFVLPISNPANLVVFHEHLPRLIGWLAAFGPASLIAIAATYAAIVLLARKSLRAPLATVASEGELGRTATTVSLAVAAAAVLLVAGNIVGLPLGTTTFGLSIAVLVFVAVLEPVRLRPILRGVHYAIVPLVAGLFVVVAAFEQHGLLAPLGELLVRAQNVTHPWGTLLAGGAIAVACNLANNLPIGLVAGYTLPGLTVAPATAHAVLVGVDLSPNVSVSGSLATLLWLAALRREGIAVNRWSFLRIGTIVALPALVLALLFVR